MLKSIRNTGFWSIYFSSGDLVHAFMLFDNEDVLGLNMTQIFVDNIFP